MKKNILFVCIENSNRSQMAEAFAKIHGENSVNAFSAGSRPLEKVNPMAVEAMKLKGYDLTLHKSKSVDEFRKMTFDYVITMGCGDECPFIRSKHRQDWDIPDPRQMDMNDFLKVRDKIEEDVKNLLGKIVV